jgi:hypothetical protein
METALLKQLQSKHVKYVSLEKHLHQISLLVAGGHELEKNLKDFIPRRQGEDKDVYDNRLRKYSYSNVLGSGISQLCSKFRNGTIIVSSDGEFWDSFRTDTNGKGRSESDLFAKIAEELITYGKVFAHVDADVVDVPVENMAQFLSLGTRPRINLYNALQVIDWQGESDNLQWLKIYQVDDYAPNPFTEKQSIARWIIITSESVLTYELSCQFDDEGNIVKFWDTSDNSWRTPTKDTVVPLKSVVDHGLGETPVRMICVSENLWAANQAYSKARESLVLECHLQDILTSSYIQRIYRPFARPDSLDSTWVDDDETPIDTRLESVIQVDDFKMIEPSGATVAALNSSLEEPRKQIRSILSLGGAYIENGVVEASGVSKEMDFEIEESRLRSYGSVLADSIQVLYRWVARFQGVAQDVSVSGLDDFSNNKSLHYLNLLKEFSLIDYDKILLLPPNLVQYVMDGFVNSVADNLPPEERERLLSVSTEETLNLSDEA